MADSLTIDQNYENCQHKEALQKQGNKFPFSVALEYGKNKFGVSPSSFLGQMWSVCLTRRSQLSSTR
jgi:hypothetical protein